MDSQKGKDSVSVKEVALYGKHMFSRFQSSSLVHSYVFLFATPTDAEIFIHKNDNVGLSSEAGTLGVTGFNLLLP